MQDVRLHQRVHSARSDTKVFGAASVASRERIRADVERFLVSTKDAGQQHEHFTEVCVNVSRVKSAHQYGRDNVGREIAKSDV